MPEEMIGVIPNSISVPLLLANIIRSQYRGSDESDETMPYKGIWLMTKKMSKVSYQGFPLAHCLVVCYSALWVGTHSCLPPSTSISD